MFAMFVIFTGITLIITNELIKREPPRVEYKYIPRDLDIFLKDTANYASLAYGEMSAKDDPWAERRSS